MKFQFILLFLLFVVILIVTQNKVQETFNPYDTCISQGYPMKWCLKASTPYSAADPCVCPPEQKLYRRYGTCYCRG